MSAFSIGWQDGHDALAAGPFLVHRIIGTDEGTVAVCGAAWNCGQVTTRVESVNCVECASTLVEPDLTAFSAAARQACSEFTAAEGAAWPWCDTCGVRADLHPGHPAIAAAVERILAR